MELQALAPRFLRIQKRLTDSLPFLCIEDLILIATLLGAHPQLRSLWIGGSMSMVALLLLFWVQGYAPQGNDNAVVGPFRFVRHPLRLSLWLLALGFGLGARSFPGLILSLGLLPCLYYFDLYLEEEQRRRQNLASYRYGRFVPALLPTIFPYHREKTDRSFSWRTGLFGHDRSLRRRLGRLALGWLLVILLQKDIIPEHAAWIAAGLWLAQLLVRTFLHRKTIRLVFT